VLSAQTCRNRSSAWKRVSRSRLPRRPESTIVKARPILKLSTRVAPEGDLLQLQAQQQHGNRGGDRESAPPVNPNITICPVVTSRLGETVADIVGMRQFVRILVSGELTHPALRSP
jgi:hypothetical protein